MMMLSRHVVRLSLSSSSRRLALSLNGTRSFSSTVFASSHEYAHMDGDEVTIGITDHAQAQLGDIVHVDLPDVGTAFEKGEELGSIESVKTAAEFYAPVSGTVTAVNEDLEGAFETINESPEENGWMVKLSTEGQDTDSEISDLMDRDAYDKFCEEEDA